MRTKAKTISGLILLLSVLMAPPVKAADWLDCPALNDPASYEERESLKYLVPGVDNWLFISNKDFISDFTLRDISIRAFQYFQKKLQERGTDTI